MLRTTKRSVILVIAIFCMTFPALSSAQNGAENAGNNTGRPGIESSLRINRGEGSIGVESSAIVNTGNGKRIGVESSLGVAGGEGRISAERSFNAVRGDEKKGVKSSLEIDGTQGGPNVKSSFGVTKNSQLEEIRNSLRIKDLRAGVTRPEVMKKIIEYRRIADEMISKEPAADGWWSSYNLCTDLSGKWLPELEKRGMKAMLSATDSNAVRATVIVNGREQQAYKFHVFLADSSLGTGENEIIFDSTYMQFLEGADKLKGLPKIFVGTHSEAEKLFARFKKNCRVEAGEGGDPLTGKYEIKSFTELIYSYGRNAAARQSFSGQ